MSNQRYDSKGAETPADPSRRRAMTSGIASAAVASVLSAGGAAAAEECQTAPNSVLSGQTALVTGAARGIGRAIAVAYARAGADIALLDIADPDAYQATLGYALGSEADLNETAGLVDAAGRRSLKIKADVADLAAMRRAVTEVVGTFGKLDIMVANAGVSAGGALHELPEARWKTVVDINLNGVANSIMAALPPMIERKSGRIITVTSILGRQATGNLSNYIASKWGIVGLTKAAAIDAGPHGITVNAIAPTGAKTGIFGGALGNPETLAAYDAGLRQSHALPVGLLEPEDIAGAAIFLASPAARHISGDVVDVAAGLNARYTG